MLREANRDDIPAMRRIRAAVRENQLRSLVITETDYVPYLEEHGRGWVVETQGEVVGFAIGSASDGNIWALFVDPNHERRGYGRQLLQAVVSWLWSQGLNQLWLTTEPNTRAHHFFEAAGWQCVGSTAGCDLRFELYRAQHDGTADNPSVSQNHG